MAVISLSGYEAASNTDILQGTRLQTIPRGRLKIELQANTSDGTNFMQASIQLPNGETPMESAIIPRGAQAGAINANDATAFVFDIPVGGGHLTLSCTETGTSGLAWRVTSMS